jgi:hypothetical protein
LAEAELSWALFSICQEPTRVPAERTAVGTVPKMVVLIKAKSRADTPPRLVAPGRRDRL